MKSNWTKFNYSLANCAFLTDNPVVFKLQNKSMTPVQGVETLRQYFYLVATIVQFLTAAMVRIPIQAAKNELMRNLGEELGSRTDGVSHQELLESLLRKELGIEVRTMWNEATKTFITSLLLDFHTRSPHAVAGMIYALEATAAPELVVVARIINLCSDRRVINVRRLTESCNPATDAGTLENFFAMHTQDFELGHESGLRKTLEEFANENWLEFEDGFYRVLSLMQIWWKQLSKA